MDFTLNHRPVTVDVEPGETLLELLRERLGLRSLKDGCAPQGVCGCCTVLVDDRPTLACMKEAAGLAGHHVRTLEGLSEEQRQLLARAFTEEHAVQCGFCTPGIAMRLHALMERKADPDLGEVRRSLAGHYCRCTGYKSIERAALRLAELRGGDCQEQAPDGQGIGASQPRYQSRELVLGERPFVADLQRPGLLHAALAFAPHPRALLKALDVTAALAAPGVTRVLTWRDIPGKRHTGLIVADWPLLVAVGEESRYVGDVVAVVVASTRRAARAAAALVRADWEPLPPLVDAARALDNEAPRLHASGNLLEACAFQRGDVDAELAASTCVVRQDFQTQRIEHAFLEPEACLVEPRADGGLHVFSPGQGVHDDQRQIASLLGLPVEKVLVELVPNGGAFGGKEDLSVQGHAALAAFLLQRPVKLALSRDESLRLHPKRHPLFMRYEVGADDQGRLRAARIRILGDSGAYASVGGKVLERAAGHSCGPYRVEAVDVEAKAVYTHNPPCGAMRGFGVNQTAFAMESVLDEIAQRLGVDRLELRRRNLLRPGDRFATGQRMTQSVMGLERCLDAVEPVYRSRPGVGLALGIKNTGIGNGLVDTGRVRLRVLPHGRLQIHTGFTEMGQGLFTILRQIVHEETGLPLDAMEAGTLSELAVLCGMTTASRATALAGAAAGDAARKLGEALRDESLEDLTGREFLGEFFCTITTAPGAPVAEPVTHMTFSYAAQVVELDGTGRIEKITAAHDVGRAINPASCRGQIEGSLHMGLGYALSEDFPCTNGQPDSLKLRDCGVLRAAETPEMEVILIEEPDEIGGYGVKGVGEIGLVPTAAAVASALRARDGRMRTRLPMREDKDLCLRGLATP
jgi:selenium-dependent xanthine dehydrogenase